MHHNSFGLICNNLNGIELVNANHPDDLAHGVKNVKDGFALQYVIRKKEQPNNPSLLMSKVNTA
jgi:hypothetical protein